MAEKRVLIRTDMTNNYNGEEQSVQEDLVDFAKNLIADTGISGTFIAGKGKSWLEWEGEEDAVDDAVSDYLDDSRVGSENVFEDKTISSRNTDTWHGHCESHADW